jgi:phage N-6-adenine-methyltransferase
VKGPSFYAHTPREKEALRLVRQGASELDVERAAKLLASFKSIDFAKEFHDAARASASLLKVRGASLEARNDAAAIIILTERRLGELIVEQPKNLGARGVPQKGRTRGSKVDPRVDAPPTLDELGVDKKLAARARALAAAPKELLEVHIASVCDRSEKLTTSGTIAAVSHGADYDSDEYYTPENFVEDSRYALGGEIDLDIASSAKANETVRAKKYFSRRDDALSEKNLVWRAKRLWFQPPFSKTVAFVQRLLENIIRGTVGSAMCLLNADTGTSWFQELASRGPLCLPKGRIGFISPEGKVLSGNRMAQVFFALGDADVHGRFLERFAQYGAVGRLEVAA